MIFYFSTHSKVLQTNCVYTVWSEVVMVLAVGGILFNMVSSNAAIAEVSRVLS